MLCVQVWNAGQHCFMAEASVLAALRERNRTGLAACRLARAEQEDEWWDWSGARDRRPPITARRA